MPQPNHLVEDRFLPALVFFAGLTAAVSGEAAPYTVAGTMFNSDNATSTAAITGGGYVTPYGTALPSWTSPDWTIAPSQGTNFQVPEFQYNYDPAMPVTGDPGTAATLGQDHRFPETSLNVRDIIQVTWGAGNGLQNLMGYDLAVFEAATSEAYAVRAHSTTSGWSTWYYRPYGADDATYDATVTEYELDDLGLAPNEIINAVEIVNLLAEDTVAELIAGTADLGLGEVLFDGTGDPGTNYAPGRYSSSQGMYVPFEDRKYDPDIQYVVGLHDILIGTVSNPISALDTGAGVSAPARLAPTGGTASVPEPGVLLLLGGGLGLLGIRRTGHGA